MKHNTLRRILMLSAALLLCALAGCAPKTPPTAQPIHIGVLRIDDSVPLYLAERDGLFAQCGVQVELVEFGSASDQMKAAEAGELDLMMTDMVVTALLKKGGADFKVTAMALGASAGEGRFLVVSAPGSGITAPEDLHGGAVAISENTMMDYLVQRYEQALGLDSAAIRKLHIPNLSLRLDALFESGDVSAAILPDPLAAFAVSRGAHIVIDDTALGQNFSQSVYVVSDRLLTENRVAAERAMEAIWLAMDRLNEAPQDYKDYCMTVANVPSAISGEYPVASYTPRALPNQAEVADVMDWMVARGLLDAPFAYEALVDGGIAAGS